VGKERKEKSFCKELISRISMCLPYLFAAESRSIYLAHFILLPL